MSEDRRLAAVGVQFTAVGEYTVITNGYDAAGNRNFTLENRLFIIKQ